MQQEQGLKPSHPASREALIRRAYFDVTGLPPTPEQVELFVKDKSPQAFEKVVDALLSSTAYGERWARHWLDTARFAESGGYEFDGFRPGAWHYRDWVIRSLNQDIPYDQLDDMMMTIGGSMLGLTLGCARCHEHKYDPIPHLDYYSLAASLAQTVHGTRPFDADPEATSAAVAKHQTEQETLRSALSKFATNELPSRFTAWKTAELGKQPETTRWQTMEPVIWKPSDPG